MSEASSDFRSTQCSSDLMPSPVENMHRDALALCRVRHYEADVRPDMAAVGSPRIQVAAKIIPHVREVVFPVAHECASVDTKAQRSPVDDAIMHLLCVECRIVPQKVEIVMQ
eukprot:8609106-Karenia_brevis.AAC.1